MRSNLFMRLTANRKEIHADIHFGSNLFSFVEFLVRLRPMSRTIGGPIAMSYEKYIGENSIRLYRIKYKCRENKCIFLNNVVS